MTDHPIRVGFIGLNPDSHWAATAHIPALRALSDTFTVVGVANSTPESGRHTAEALGLPHAFASAKDLVASPEVDLVVVTVKVPHHLELVTAALEAGKHVYCEWPLGNGLVEARKLAQLAQERGVVAVAGTQARTALEVEHVRKLIADGYVGEVLSTTLVGSGGNWAGETTADYYYLFDKKNGATMQSIPLAHTLAAMRDVLGDFGALSARFASRFDTVRVTDTGETRPKTAPDQIMAHGTLASGAAVSIHYRGGVCRGTNLLWEINGTEGDIQVTAGLGHAQMVPLTVRGARGEDKTLAPLMPPESAYANWPKQAAARNVARIYARLADDIRHGTRTAPTFQDAVALHEWVDAIEQSAEVPG
ncbi:Gfo/Idh/MocA family protein [Salinicola peritrichatus]|uniref:Gfo/Idh/MocA family protein n=1 Tax=Salinicola peritrichatus TaxID=1267424 RepID=UPI000DA24795|nr:Gfo/Idh/MocA family oxidoreductase [Salinicola peritrichatus]